MSLRLAVIIVVCLLTAALMREVRIFRGRRLQALLGMVASLVIYGRSFFAIFVLIVIVWAVAKIILSLEGIESSKQWRAAVVAVGILSLVFLFGREWGWGVNEARYGAFSVIWFSMDMWLVLRLVTFLLEIGSGAASSAPFPEFLSWCFLPFWIFGPVLRFSEFLLQIETDAVPRMFLEQLPEWRRLVVISILQLGLGFVFEKTQVEVASWHTLHPVASTLTNGLLFGPFGFYLSAAGFFHAMEITAGIAGFVLPPSFRNPFLKRNISEFWANWNISATSIFRDYIYYNRWGLKLHHQYFNVLILFLLVGLWHGMNAYWIIWGALHGVGFAIFVWARERVRTPNGLAGTSLVPAWAATAATYLFVCMCWIIPPTIMRVINLASP